MTLKSPPSAASVARRLFAVFSTAHAATLHTDEDATGKDFDELRSFLEETELAVELQPEERKLVTARPGKISFDQAEQLSWLFEGAEILGWALGQAKLPRGFWDQVNPRPLGKKIGFLQPKKAKAFLAKAKLRPAKELERYVKTIAIEQRKCLEFPFQHEIRAAYYRQQAARWLVGKAMKYSEAASGPSNLADVVEDSRRRFNAARRKARGRG